MEQTALLAPPEPPQPLDSGHPPDSDLYGMWKLRVNGEAVPQGSMKGTLNNKTGRVVVFASNNTALKAWRETVARTAAACKPSWLREPWDGPIFMGVVFVRERGDDYLADGVTLRASAKRYPDTAPDGDKLDRSIWDALTGVAFTNDARVVSWVGAKRFAGPGEPAHVLIDVGFLRP